MPHTADIRIEAWGPTRDTCLAEAVAALVDSFADTSGARPERTLVAELAAGDDADRLAAVLEEVIYRLDTEDVIPLGVEVVDRPGHLLVRMPVVPRCKVELVGAVPKAVALSGLRLSRDDGNWSCTAIIDV